MLQSHQPVARVQKICFCFRLSTRCTKTLFNILWKNPKTTKNYLAPNTLANFEFWVWTCEIRKFLPHLLLTLHLHHYKLNIHHIIIMDHNPRSFHFKICPAFDLRVFETGFDTTWFANFNFYEINSNWQLRVSFRSKLIGTANSVIESDKKIESVLTINKPWNSEK